MPIIHVSVVSLDGVKKKLSEDGRVTILSSSVGEVERLKGILDAILQHFNKDYENESFGYNLP